MLTPRQKAFLKSLAHPLEPVVRVGAAGVTDAVVAKTEAELENHELLKVKVDGDRDTVADAADRLAKGTRSELVQIIGKTVVLYRRRAKKPEIRFPG